MGVKNCKNYNKNTILLNKNNLVVLSLFDGISCGRIALERANIEVDRYYASEIDKYAIQISKKNYPDIIQLGDINNWKEWNVDWGNIDLLIGLVIALYVIMIFAINVIQIKIII